MPEVKTKVAVVTGPTGGHFFPGLAMGEGLAEKGKIEVYFFVPRRRYLADWLEKKGFGYNFIPEVRLTFRNFLFPVKFLHAFFRACLFLSAGRFDCVVITGSYATVPFLAAARFFRARIFVHEQNYLPGRVTKISARIADRIALSFSSYSGLPEKKCVVSGFPVMSDFMRRFPRAGVLDEFGFSAGNKTVLVLGGSQGALFINELIIRNLEFLKGKNVQFLHLAGRGKDVLAGEYGKHGVPARVYDFYYDMAKLYSVADLVICRAGAGTLAEISGWNLPAIVVPYPYAGGHQKYNALYFEERGGCKMLEQNMESIKAFPAVFEKAIKELDVMKQNMKKASIADSRGGNVDRILELLDGKKHS